MSYRLIDVEAKYKQSPKTDFLPHSEERMGLSIGDTVRLILSTESEEQHGMWFAVKFAKDLKFVGTLIEFNPSFPALESGSELPFGPQHVANIWSEKGDKRWFDPGQLALVSRQMFDGKEWPGKLIRFRHPNPEYSGWIIMAGTEPKAYMNDTANFFPMRVNELVKRYPPFAAVCARPHGDTFKWDDGKAEYSKVVPL